MVNRMLNKLRRYRRPPTGNKCHDQTQDHPERKPLTLSGSLSSRLADVRGVTSREVIGPEVIPVVADL